VTCASLQKRAATTAPSSISSKAKSTAVRAASRRERSFEPRQAVRLEHDRASMPAPTAMPVVSLSGRLRSR
jgi:hypothetical protein